RDLFVGTFEMVVAIAPSPEKPSVTGAGPAAGGAPPGGGVKLPRRVRPGWVGTGPGIAFPGYGVAYPVGGPPREGPAGGGERGGGGRRGAGGPPRLRPSPPPPVPLPVLPVLFPARPSFRSAARSAGRRPVGWAGVPIRSRPSRPRPPRRATRSWSPRWR